MAKHGTFSFSTDQNDVVYLASAAFKNAKFVAYANTAGVTPRNIYRLSWFNLGHFADCGSVEGTGLPMTIGQADYTEGAFTFGETYVFSLSIFSENTTGPGNATWRKLKPKLSRRFEPAIVVPTANCGVQQTPDAAAWLIPVAHEMMI